MSATKIKSLDDLAVDEKTQCKENIYHIPIFEWRSIPSGGTRIIYSWQKNIIEAAGQNPEEAIINLIVEHPLFWDNPLDTPSDEEELYFCLRIADIELPENARQEDVELIKQVIPCRIRHDNGWWHTCGRQIGTINDGSYYGACITGTHDDPSLYDGEFGGCIIDGFIIPLKIKHLCPCNDEIYVK